MFVLLIVIYLTFISLGLPDSLLGSAWPIIQMDFSVSLGSAGIVFMIISGGTIVSSLFSNRIITKFGTGKVTFVSVLMTAAALFGFSISPNFLWMCAMGIPLGLGAGSIDAALNNFVALHYKANHMSWLHCFWGVGATTGPIIMSFFLKQGNWKQGYFSISMIQAVLAIVVLFSLPLWKKASAHESAEEEKEKTMTNREALAIPGVKIALFSFVCYCAVEAMTGLWSSSYLVNCKGLAPELAARWVSYFYAGITIGRLVTGFLTMKFNNKLLIRFGQTLCVVGITGILLPLPAAASMIGLVLLGLGCAPIYPCMLHETPARFGKRASLSVIGLQMAFAYVGSTFVPSILGAAATAFSIGIFPYFLLIAALIMLSGSEILNRYLKRKAC